MPHHADPHRPLVQRLLALRTVLALYVARNCTKQAIEAPPAVTDDLTQETLARGIEGLPRFEESTGDLRSWLFGIASHVVIDEKRSRYLRDRRFSRTALDPESIASADSLPDRELHAKRCLERVAKVFLSMPEHWQLIVMLVGIDGKSHAYVAELLGISPDATKKHLERARAHLEKRSGVHRKDLRFAFPFLFRDGDGDNLKPGVGFLAGGIFALASAFLLLWFGVQYQNAPHTPQVLEPITPDFKYAAILIEPLPVEPTPNPPPIAPIKHIDASPTSARRAPQISQKQQSADASNAELDAALSQLGRSPFAKRK